MFFVVLHPVLLQVFWKALCWCLTLVTVLGVCRTLLSRYAEVLVVPDLRDDVRFKDYPIVTGYPNARFYAASPLVNQAGARLGTL